MEILYLLIPVALILVVVIAGAFLWAIRSGQFDDMEGPAHSILMDKEGPVGYADESRARQQDSGDAHTAERPSSDQS